MKAKYIFLKCFLILFFEILKSQTTSDVYISDVQGNQNPTISCSYPFVNGSCVQLTANYPQFRLTDSYQVSSVPYAPYSAPTKTVIKDNLDDVFTKVIDLPFSFCFYGKSYRKLVIV